MSAGRPILKHGLPPSPSTKPIFLFSIFLVFLIAISPVSATPSNFTIDDQGEDPETGKLVVYQPSDAWANQSCTGCAIHPDVNQLFNHTATAATFGGNESCTIDFDFTGTAIYIFFTLFSNEGPGITVNTDCTFFVDNVNSSTFHHAGDPSAVIGTGQQYGVLVFNQTGMTQQQHHMTISMSTADASSNIFLSFDRAVYTTDPDPPTTSSAPISTSTFRTSAGVVVDATSPSTTMATDSSSSSVSPGVIAGGIIGGLAVFAGFIALVVYYRRDNQRYRTPSSPERHIPRPFIHPSLSSRMEEGHSDSSSAGAQPSATNPTITSFPLSQQSSATSRSVSSPSVSSSRSGSRSASSHGSVENQIQVASQRMRSLRAEMASVSGRTGTSSGSGGASNADTATAKLAEEVKKLRQEIQVLKQAQREQTQTQTQGRPLQPTFEEPPPTYTDD